MIDVHYPFMPMPFFLSLLNIKRLKRFCHRLEQARRSIIGPLALAVIMLGVASPSAAQSAQWQVVILSATSAGWVETKGTATISQDFSQIYVKDTRGMNREVFRGELKSQTWTGTRSVINTEKLGEAVGGQYTQRTIDRYRVETLILTSGTASANFIRTELVQ